MHRVQSLILVTALLVATTVSAAQTSSGVASDTALCESMATQIRSSVKTLSGASNGDPLSMLSKGEHPLVVLPGKPDMDLHRSG